jgi:hypothetical protein
LVGLCLASSLAQAQPIGIVALGGVVFTPTTTFSNKTHTPTVNAMTGPIFQGGFEVGNYFNNQFTFVYANVSGTASSPDTPGQVYSAQGEVIAGGYQLTIDILGKAGAGGFTPYLGGGGELGVANVNYSTNAAGMTILKSEQDLFAEIHLVGGFRYTAPFGLGLRAEVAFSAFGPFIGTWIPEFGAAWSF